MFNNKKEKVVSPHLAQTLWDQHMSRSGLRTASASPLCSELEDGAKEPCLGRLIFSTTQWSHVGIAPRWWVEKSEHALKFASPRVP